MLALALLATAATAAAPYRALGTEPFWSLSIAGRTLRLEQPDRRTVVVRDARIRPSFNGARYVSARMVVDVTHARCSDGMSDRVYPDTVTVTIGRRRLSGCGDASAAPVALAGTDWSIVAVDGTAVPRATGLRFDGDRVSGSAGCNRISGRYALTGDRFTAEALATTRMMCAPAAMAAERRVLAILRAATVTRAGDRMTLAAPSGKLVLRAR